MSIRGFLGKIKTIEDKGKNQMSIVRKLGPPKIKRVVIKKMKISSEISFLNA